MAAQGVLDQAVLAVAKQIEDQVDSEINKLSNLGEDDIEALRQKRLEEMRRLGEKKQQWLADGHGEIKEINEKEFFQEVKGVERVLCLFYRDSMPCKVHNLHILGL